MQWIINLFLYTKQVFHTSYKLSLYSKVNKFNVKKYAIKEQRARNIIYS